MRCLLPSLILGALCWAPLSLSAAVLTVPTALDGQIRSSGSSFSNTVLLLGKTATAGDSINGLFAFDVAAILPEGAVIESISLTLRMDVGDPGAVQTFSLYTVLRPFTSEATWTQYASPDGSGSHLWSTPGAIGVDDRGALLSTTLINPYPTVEPPATQRGTPYTFGSSNAFVDAANAALSNDELLRLWVGIDDSSTSRTVFRAVSSEGSEVYRPALSITYSTIPEPGSVALLVGAAGVLAMVRRRK